MKILRHYLPEAKYLGENLFTTWDNMLNMCNRHNMSGRSVWSLQGEPYENNYDKILSCTGSVK